MHTCILSATSEFGGVETHILSLARYLRTRGHEITLAILGDDVFTDRVTDLSKRMHVIHVPCDFRRNGYREALKPLSRLPGDACVFQKGCFESGSLAFEIAARLRFRRFVTIEQLEAESLVTAPRQHHLGVFPGLGLWRPWARFSGYFRSLAPNRIVCVSDAVKRKLQKQYFFPSRKMILAANGVDVALFRRDAAGRAELRGAINANSETVVFGAVARFSPVKRLDVAVKCFGELVKKYPALDARLLLYGEGSERERLQTLISQQGLDARAHLRPFTDRPAKVLSALDVFLMPSANEGMPFALLEAMACECYPIATDVGGNREALADGCGVSVSAGDDVQFAAAMEECLHLGCLERSAVGKQARQRVEKLFALENQLERIASLLEF